MTGGADPGPAVGMGVLSWGGLASLREALESYSREDLFSLFDEVLVFLPEMTDEGAALAREFGLPFAGSPQNLGILGGFRTIAESMTSPILLLMENDCPLIEPRAEAARQIALARDALAREEVAAFRMRHTLHPGQKFPGLAKYARYYGPGVGPALRRALRPGKARRLAGNALYMERAPERRFPDLFTRTAEGWLSVSAACLPWTNQSVMVRRDFYLDTIAAFAEANPTTRTRNGFPGVEKEWNRPRWRNSGWRIGSDRGLFTHERIDGPDLGWVRD